MMPSLRRSASLEPPHMKAAFGKGVFVQAEPRQAGSCGAPLEDTGAGLPTLSLDTQWAQREEEDVPEVCGTSSVPGPGVRGGSWQGTGQWWALCGITALRGPPGMAAVDAGAHALLTKPGMRAWPLSPLLGEGNKGSMFLLPA